MMGRLYNIIRLTLVFILTVILSACGGSSDDPLAKYSISTGTSSIVFANEFLQTSDDSFKINITFQGDGLLVGYAPDSQPAGWLNFRTEDLTSNSATLYVDVVNAENIIADLYKTKLRLSTGDVDKLNLVHHDIDISLFIWQLITDKALVSFRDTFGVESIAAQTLTLNSGTDEWSIATDVEWLTLDINSVTGESVLTITPDISNFSLAQLYQGNITLTEASTGDIKVIPVEVGLDNKYLFSDQSTLSFTKLANIDATSKTIALSTNNATALNWQAISNVDWLTLTKIANTNKLTVSINPSVSVSEAQNNAVITVNAVDENNNVDDSVIPEIINVSYYQSTTASQRQVISELSVNSNALVNSPWLPHVYMGINNQLNVYHQYSGELLSTLDVAPEGSLLEQLIIHPDGELLLAKANETITNEDESTSLVAHRYRINLTDNTVVEITDATIEYEPIQYLSFSGRHFIVTQTLEYADNNLQRTYWDVENTFLTTRINQASVTEAFYALDPSDSSFKRYTATVNDFTSNAIVVTQTHQYRPEFLAEDQAVSDFIVEDSEAGIYAISPTSEWISFNGEIYTDHGLLEQSQNIITLDLEKSHNSRAHFLRYDTSSGYIIDVYDGNQVLANSIPTQGQLPTNIELSQDDKRLIIHASNAEQVEIINVEQFTLSNQLLAFTTTFGDNTIADQEIALSGVSDSWQAQSSSEWLVLTTNNENNQPFINAAIDKSKINGSGLFTASITITDPLSGSSSIVTVTLAVDEVRLYANHPALAFTAQTNKSTLAHTVDIFTNRQSEVLWQAQSNVNWLTLTTDTVNNLLTATVDPTMVSTNGLHDALITISSQTANQSKDGTINISFSKGDFNSGDFEELVIENIVPNNSGVILDPLRPYLYVAQEDKINIYNIIDGSTVSSIQSPLADINLTNLVIHPDGSMLLTSNSETYLDENELEQTRTNYYRVNLTDFSISQLNAQSVDIFFPPIKIAMFSGEAMVITQALELADLSLTRHFWDNENTFLTSIIADVPNNNTFIAYDGTNDNLRHNTIDYNSFSDSLVSISSSIDYINPAYASDISSLTTNNDGNDIYTTNINSEWSTNNAGDFADQGLLDGNSNTIPVKVIMDSDESSYFYRFDAGIGYFTLTKYDHNKVQVWITGYTAGSVDVYMSAEHQRVIHYNATDSKLVIDFMPD